MSGEKRSKYQQEMDQVQLSDEKAEETLQLLLEANRKSREADTRKTSKLTTTFWTRRFLPAFTVAAACLVLVLIGMKDSGKVKFDTVRLNQLPVSGISRGDDGQEVDFDKAFGCSAESLFPGWSVTVSRVVQHTTSSGTQSEGVLQIRKDDVELTAEVTQYEPALYTALGKNKSGLDGVQLNLDPDTGIRYAVISHEKLYMILSSSKLSEDDFIKVVRKIVAVWNTNNT